MKNPLPKKVKKLVWIFLFIGIIFAFTGTVLGKMVISVVGVIVMLCSIIFQGIFYRCPHCGKYLDRSTGEYCPYCGEEVNK